jgi:hypothetical protein
MTSALVQASGRTEQRYRLSLTYKLNEREQLLLGATHFPQVSLAISRPRDLCAPLAIKRGVQLGARRQVPHP